jgi:hypothetical protein
MNRRILYLVVATLLAATSAEAQRSHLGILAGPTAGMMSGSYVDASSGVEMGFSFLATLDREFGDILAVTIGAGWVQKGGRRLALADRADTTYGYQTSYVEVPVSLSAKFRLANGRLSLAPHAGVAVGFGMGCKWKPGEQFEFEGTCAADKPGGELSSIDVGIPIGVTFAVEFPGGSRFTIADVGYELGLSNVLSGAEAAGQSVKSGVLSYRFGFAVPLY